MNPFSRKVQHRSTQETAHEQECEVRQGQTRRQFDQVEDLLRHDAAQTPVPPALSARLRQSLAQALPPRRKWWKLWLQ